MIDFKHLFLSAQVIRFPAEKPFNSLCNKPCHWILHYYLSNVTIFNLRPQNTFYLKPFYYQFQRNVEKLTRTLNDPATSSVSMFMIWNLFIFLIQFLSNFVLHWLSTMVFWSNPSSPKLNMYYFVFKHLFFRFFSDFMRWH